MCTASAQRPSHSAERCSAGRRCSMTRLKAASATPSPKACRRRAVQRPAPSAGSSRGPVPSWSRYSQITGLSNNASPSTVIKAGTFDSGLAASNAGSEAWALVVTRSIWLSISRVIAQAMTLRTNGLVAE